MKKWKIWLLSIVGVITLCGIICILLFRFSYLPFFKTTREIFIQTAMHSRSNHHKLATSFFSAAKIKEAMHEDEQRALDNVIAITNLRKEDEVDKRVGSSEYEQDHLLHSYLHVGEKDFKGGTVVVNDTKNDIVISKVKHDMFVGYIALIGNPGKVFVGNSKYGNSAGDYIKNIVKQHKAVLGVNASGFSDYDSERKQWLGDGGDLVGLSMSRGKSRGFLLSNFGTVALDTSDRLIVGRITNWSKYNIRDGAQFTPPIIKNGKKLVKGTAGWGIAPRTIVGQRADGVIVFLVVDGRQPGYSIGATLEDCADLLLKYDVKTAGMLDGGASSIMVYKGKTVNKPCGKGGWDGGRRVPNAFLVSGKN